MSRLQGVSRPRRRPGRQNCLLLHQAQAGTADRSRDDRDARTAADVCAHPQAAQCVRPAEQAESKLDILSPRQRALAELKSATTVRCEYCIDLGSQIARQWGLSDEELLAMADYRNASCFSEVDKLILEYATAIARTPVEVSDRLFDGLRAHFDTPQLVGLTHVITLGNLRARFNIALDIGSSGFSGDRVCALPDGAGT